LEQLAVGDDCGIEGDLHDLGVSRRAGADRFVARMGHMPARVARGHTGDATQLLEHGLEAPETAAGERREFHTTNLTHPQSFDSGATRRNVFRKAYGESRCGMRDAGWVVWGRISLPVSRIPRSVSPCTSSASRLSVPSSFASLPRTHSSG